MVAFSDLVPVNVPVPDSQTVAPADDLDSCCSTREDLLPGGILAFRFGNGNVHGNLA